MKLYSLLIVPKKLKFLPIYKFSQNHLELFFGAIRSHGGYNNNPTARQFRSSYRKLIIHATIRDGGLGNCIPQDQIGVLNTSSVQIKEPTDFINETCLLRNIDVELDAEQLHLQDHNYIANTNSLSSFSEEAISYKAGFVAHQLESKIKCDVCVNALFGEKENFF